MRISRSCSSRHKTCIRTCKPDCCKPCCLPRRRCQSLSPVRHRRRFFERPPCSPCDSDPCGSCDSSCLPKSRTCVPRICSPRRRFYRDSDSCSGKTCFPRSYYPCSPDYSCKRDACFPRTCEPCVTKRDYCLPRTYIPTSPCYPRSCRPCSRPTWNSRISCSPCLPLKCDPCYPLNREPLYTSRRRLSTDCYVPRACSPLCSPIGEACKPCYSTVSRRRYCMPCDDASEALANIKLRDLRCDNFSKVCYPKDLPLKSCATEDCKCDACNCSCSTSQEPTCEVAKVDTVRSVTDEGPSRNFLQKSRRVGTCMGRYEPHFCPWEADVSISGTVRGHCTSTAVEVARRMSGRFRAEGDRFTKDSCESIAPCTSECQKMSLGRLDDGTSLNFSRNMSRNDNKSQESAPESSKSIKDCFRTKKNRQSDNNHSENYNSCYSSACRENVDVSSDNRRSRRVTSNEQTSFDDDLKEQRFVDEGIKERKSYCSRRASNHNVRFGPNNDRSSSRSVPETKELPQFDQDDSVPYSEVQNFLNSRKDRRRRIRARSPQRDISGNTPLNSPPVIQRSGHRECKSPSNYSFRYHRKQMPLEGDSPLFTPPTHCSSIGSRRFSSSSSQDDLDSVISCQDHSRKKKENTEYHEVSLDGAPIVANRSKGYRQKRGVDGLQENKRRR